MGARYAGRHAPSSEDWTARTNAKDAWTIVPSPWIVMIRRAFPAFVALIALNQTASAGVPLFGHVSCSVVRFYVSKYSEAAAESGLEATARARPKLKRRVVVSILLMCRLQVRL